MPILSDSDVLVMLGHGDVVLQANTLPGGTPVVTLQALAPADGTPAPVGRRLHVAIQTRDELDRFVELLEQRFAHLPPASERRYSVLLGRRYEHYRGADRPTAEARYRQLLALVQTATGAMRELAVTLCEHGQPIPGWEHPGRTCLDDRDSGSHSGQDAQQVDDGLRNVRI